MLLLLLFLSHRDRMDRLNVPRRAGPGPGDGRRRTPGRADAGSDGHAEPPWQTASEILLAVSRDSMGLAESSGKQCRTDRGRFAAPIVKLPGSLPLCSCHSSSESLRRPSTAAVLLVELQFSQEHGPGRSENISKLGSTYYAMMVIIT